MSGDHERLIVYFDVRFAAIQAGIDGYDAAILLNSRGKVAEGQSMCLFLIRDGVAVTPSVTSDFLLPAPGVTSPTR